MSITVLNWIVPSTILLCGLAFIAIKRLDFATARWGYALCSLAVGYALMLFETERFSPFKQILEDSFILFSIILATRALRYRLGLTGRLLFEVAIMGLAVAMVTVSLTVFKSVRLETLSVEACCAWVLWTTSLPFSRRAEKRADRVLAITFLFLSALLTSQCLLFIAAPHVGHAVGAWRSSIWGSLVQYTGLVGSVALAFCVMVAVADDAVEQHRSDANTDPLTNLLNRRGLEALLTSRRGQKNDVETTAVILADIDHFKSINDRFGHFFGDQVIKRFGALLKAQAPHPGCAVRLGGEEFLILLPGGSLEEAISVADGIRRNFALEHGPSSEAVESFTASFGVAAHAVGKETIAEAMRRADRLLYSAKQFGRNCVVSQQGDIVGNAYHLAVTETHQSLGPFSPSSVEADRARIFGGSAVAPSIDQSAGV